MKKDIIIAVIVGFVLGSSSAFLIINLPNLIKKSTQPPAVVNNLTPTVALVNKTSPLLSVESPADESIASSKTINISGKTAAGSIIVLDTDMENTVKEASEDGRFSLPISLKEGANSILITPYNENGEGETKTLTVFYTGDKL